MLRVVSVDGYSCVYCKAKYNVDKGVVFDSATTYRCQIDYKGGFVGEIDSETSFKTKPISCWDAEQVVNNNECQSCTFNYESDGLIFNISAPLKCSPDSQSGYAGKLISAIEIDHQFPITYCWATQQVVSADQTQCVTCDPSMKFSAGQCVQKGNNKSVIAIAICVPLAVIIILTVSIAIWKKNQKKNAQPVQTVPIPAVETETVQTENIDEEQNIVREVVVQ
ncbi:Growth_factor receptor cysteine-rich domain superfamily [Hexamita inflata]|uniref:Growth factor receptor cysteine-rich domain superfamily n=1 Tax=Hexamita inflata TaxID=28002 RepID=A0AA86PL06_9EUKA|nr:Growth factor receptor cysteine-rich domain superfamily [Hexamita inflata]